MLVEEHSSLTHCKAWQFPWELEENLIRLQLRFEGAGGFKDKIPDIGVQRLENAEELVPTGSLSRIREHGSPLRRKGGLQCQICSALLRLHSEPLDHNVPAEEIGSRRVPDVTDLGKPGTKQ